MHVRLLGIRQSVRGLVFAVHCFFFVILKLGVMSLSVLYCGTPYRYLIQCCSSEHIIFLFHEALGNKLSYRYVVTNPSFLNIVINLTCKTCLFFLFFLELNFSFFRHFVYLHLSISYPVLLSLFGVAAILKTSPSSLETRDLLCARVFSRAAAILKSEKTLGTRLVRSGD